MLRYCECGCGLEVTGWNYKKKQPIRFRNNHCDKGRFRKGTKIPIEKNTHWKGGRFGDGHGYILVRKPDHPFANQHGYVKEHRLVMENHLGRILLVKEHVHHKNGNRTDNRIENLELMSRSEHIKHHVLERPIRERLYWGKNRKLK